MFSKLFQKQFTLHLHFQVKTTNVPKFPSIMANQNATEPLCPKKIIGEDSPLPSDYGLMHVFDLSSQISIEEEEDIAMGQEHLDLTSADTSFEKNENAEPFFVTEVFFVPKSTHQDLCDVHVRKLVLFHFLD